MRVCHWVVKFQRIIRDDGAKKVQVVRGLMMSHSRQSVREWVREELVRLFNFNEIHHHLTSHHISKRLHCVLALWRACVVIFKIQRFQGHLFTSSPSFFIFFIWVASRSTNTFAMIFIRNSIFCLPVCCVYGLSTDGWAEDDAAWNVRFVEIARHKQKSESANALKFKLALPKCRVRDNKNVLNSFHRVMMPDCSTLFVSYNSFASGWYFNSSNFETRCWAQISLLTALEKVQRRLLTRIQSSVTHFISSKIILKTTRRFNTARRKESQFPRRSVN